MEHQEELHNGSSSSMSANMDGMEDEAGDHASSEMEEHSSDASSMQNGFSSSMGAMTDDMEEENHASEDVEGENHSENNSASSAMQMSDEGELSSSSFGGGMNGAASSSMMSQSGFGGFRG